MKILAELCREPAFEELQAYLQRLKQGSDKIDTDGSAIWDVDTFTEGVQRSPSFVDPKGQNNTTIL
jgi:hypothetical protein